MGDGSRNQRDEERGGAERGSEKKTWLAESYRSRVFPRLARRDSLYLVSALGFYDTRRSYVAMHIFHTLKFTRTRIGNVISEKHRDVNLVLCVKIVLSLKNKIK